MTGIAQIGWPAATEGRILWTLAVFAGLVLIGYGLHWLIGRLLGSRADDDLVDIAELSLDTLLVALAAALLTGIWDVGTALSRQLDQVDPDRAGVKIVVSLLTLAAAYGVTKIVSQVISRAGDREAVTDHRSEVAVHLTQVVAFVLSGFVVLAVWRVDLGNLLVGAGFLGLVVGLAARQTLGVAIAGFVLLFSRPFEVGDWVVIDDQEGVVTDVTIHNTRLRTFRGEYVMIPNDKVTGTDIVNRSRRGRLRVSVDVGVDYETDVESAATVAYEAMTEVDAVIDAPDPEVVAKAFGDSAVVLECRFWIDDPSARKMWDARTNVVDAVKDAFEREGIEIPFPQRVLSSRSADDPGIDAGEVPFRVGQGPGPDGGEGE